MVISTTETSVELVPQLPVVLVVTESTDYSRSFQPPLGHIPTFWPYYSDDLASTITLEKEKKNP